MTLNMFFKLPVSSFLICKIKKVKSALLNMITSGREVIKAIEEVENTIQI